MKIIIVLTEILFFGGICISAGGIFQTDKQGFPKMLRVGVFMFFFGLIGLLFIKMYLV